MNKTALTLAALLFFTVQSPAIFAKKKDKTSSNPRLQNMSSEDQELFSALTKKQQKRLQEGKVEEGDNEWMVLKALGQPYYNSEHHPVFVDYEEVWLFTKPQAESKVDEKNIVDPQTNWPTLHRLTTTKTCTIGDFFLLFDRGVVKKIVKDDSGKTYGSCVVNTTEEFLPIVDGKPVAPKS